MPETHMVIQMPLTDTGSLPVTRVVATTATNSTNSRKQALVIQMAQIQAV